jgi:hypothetical protein
MAITISFILISDTHQGRVWNQTTQPELVAKPWQRREFVPAPFAGYHAVCQFVTAVVLLTDELITLAQMLRFLIACVLPCYYHWEEVHCPCLLPPPSSERVQKACSVWC